ncbi:ER membrane protein complex subunit 7 homolog [Rhipicephalus sanguineus]|uniref:ER membrane protein complex subunit 7 homolog n=1 Tax=Rhipicephalus sanguineus TaxID=34632 RepID=UPI00189345DB|nr:ER membrane protein complex subunit 7 homolog [Rhipicephalus sanguineus]
MVACFLDRLRKIKSDMRLHSLKPGYLQRACALLFQLAFLISSVGVVASDEDVVPEKHVIEGKVVPPEIATSEWLTSTRILVNGGEQLGFLRSDGSFSVHNLAPGSYVVEVANPDHVYEPVRVDINSKGKFRARRVNYIQSNLIQTLAYPLKLKSRGPFQYFQIRETWRITDFLMNPMVLMMVVPLLLIMVLPKLMNAADPETQREMHQMQMPKYDMPELSEMMTTLFTGGNKRQQQAKTTRVAKKR